MKVSEKYYDVPSKEKQLIVLNTEKLKELKAVFENWNITVDNNEVNAKFKAYLKQIQEIIDKIIKKGEGLKQAIDTALTSRGKPSTNNQENINKIKRKLQDLQSVLKKQVPTTARAEAPIYRDVTNDDVGNFMQLMSKLNYFYKFDKLQSALDEFRSTLNEFILRLQYEMTILSMMEEIIKLEGGSTDDNSQEVLNILTRITETKAVGASQKSAIKIQAAVRGKKVRSDAAKTKQAKQAEAAMKLQAAARAKQAAKSIPKEGNTKQKIAQYEKLSKGSARAEALVNDLLFLL